MKELKNEKLFTTHGFNGCDLDCLTGREIASQHASPDDQSRSRQCHTEVHRWILKDTHVIL